MGIFLFNRVSNNNQSKSLKIENKNMSMSFHHPLYNKRQSIFFLFGTYTSLMLLYAVEGSEIKLG